MGSKKWRVRFAPTSQTTPGNGSSRTSPAYDGSGQCCAKARRVHSKFACQACKLSRVKCNEAYPVCQRCERRGIICIPAARKTTWNVELPLLIKQASIGSSTNKDQPLLLKHWFESTCHIMALDPDANPLSLPLLTFLQESPALLHVVQSISAVHRNDFQIHSMHECLIERERALTLIQGELHHVKHHPVSTFLAIFLLGISSPWIEHTLGMEHLAGARSVIDILLDEPHTDPHSVNFVLGIYIWWEMACSFNLESQFQKPLDTKAIYGAVQAASTVYHPLTGYSLEIFYLLATLNHYCRRIVDGCPRDIALEATLEEQMLNWEPCRIDRLLFLLSDAFRKHGLIQLRRICGHREDSYEASEESNQENERSIANWAEEAMSSLFQIPLTSPYAIFQGIPLLSAAAELSEPDEERRVEAKRRFKAMYSISRLPVMLEAIDLLEEIWELRRSGLAISWLVMSKRRDRLISFG